MNKYTNLSEELERGLKVGYWEKKLIPLVNELVEKEIPKKPLYKGKFPVCGHNDCIKLLHSINQNRCDKCGGVIDWSDKNE